jgi:hypothetical protein
MISLYGNKIFSTHLEGLNNKILKIEIYELLFFTILYPKGVMFLGIG